jgi:hypothetical protein
VPEECIKKDDSSYSITLPYGKHHGRTCVRVGGHVKLIKTFWIKGILLVRIMCTISACDSNPSMNQPSWKSACLSGKLASGRVRFEGKRAAGEAERPGDDRQPPPARGRWSGLGQDQESWVGAKARKIVIPLRFRPQS